MAHLTGAMVTRMSSHDNIVYTFAPIDVLSTTNHRTGHVHLYITREGRRYAILGHNREHDNLAVLGGFSNAGETLLETIQREFMEESLGCIFDTGTIKGYLESGTVYTRTSSMGQHYTVVCDIGECLIDIDEVNAKFRHALKDPNLTADQRENDFLVMVPLDEIGSAIEGNDSDVLVQVNLDGKDMNLRIRNINIPGYKFVLSNLDTVFKNKQI